MSKAPADKAEKNIPQEKHAAPQADKYGIALPKQAQQEKTSKTVLKEATPKELVPQAASSNINVPFVSTRASGSPSKAHLLHDAKEAKTHSAELEKTTPNVIINPRVEISSKNIGIEGLPSQSVKRKGKDGYKFNFMVIGDSQIGKSTLMESLLDMDLGLEPSASDLDTFMLDPNTYKVQGEAVPVQVMIVETCGYGDVEREVTADKIEAYIEDQFKAFFSDELRPRREKKFFLNDTMIHLCIFMVSPKGLKSLDEQVLKRISPIVNLVPVIAKADTLTEEAKDRLKKECRAFCKNKGIKLYKFPENDEKYGEMNKAFNELVPFTVIGSSELSMVKDREVRARKYPWGLMNIEDERYSDFAKFRAATIWTNILAMVTTTREEIYEHFRMKTLQELGFNPKDIRQGYDVLLKRIRADQASEEKTLKLTHSTKLRNMIAYVEDLQKQYGQSEGGLNEEKARVAKLEEKIKLLEKQIRDMKDLKRTPSKG